MGAPKSHPFDPKTKRFLWYILYFIETFLYYPVLDEMIQLRIFEDLVAFGQKDHVDHNPLVFSSPHLRDLLKLAFHVATTSSQISVGHNKLNKTGSKTSVKNFDLKGSYQFFRKSPIWPDLSLLYPWHFQFAELQTVIKNLQLHCQKSLSWKEAHGNL